MIDGQREETSQKEGQRTKLEEAREPSSRRGKLKRGRGVERDGFKNEHERRYKRQEQTVDSKARPRGGPSELKTREADKLDEGRRTNKYKRK